MPLVLGLCVSLPVIGTGLVDESFDSVIQGLFVGTILTATSVAITVSVLKELGKINTRIGTTIVSAAIIDDVIGMIVLSVMTSLGSADSGADLTGFDWFKAQWWGTSIMIVAFFAAAFALALAIAVAAAVAACASPIARIFNSEGDALMQSIAVPGLRLYFIAAPFAGFNIVLCSFFAAGERALPAQLLTFLRGFLLLLPAAFAFSALWGVTGAWLSFPAAEFLTAALGAALLFAHRKNKKGGRGQAIGPAAGKPDVKDISAVGEL